MVVYSNLTSDDVMVVTLAEGWTWSCDIHEQVKFIHCIMHSSGIFEYLEVVDIQKRNTFVILCNSSTPSSLRLKNCLKPGAGEWRSCYWHSHWKLALPEAVLRSFQKSFPELQN